MGMLTRVGVEKTYERNGTQSKMVVIELDNDGYVLDHYSHMCLLLFLTLMCLLLCRYRFKCTLFGPYVDMLNSFLASGETENVIVVILLAKVKIFQGDTQIYQH
jgi:hypothetical protein